MSARVSQHRMYHGVILKDFCMAVGLEPNKENLDELKRMFKNYLKVASVSILSDQAYSKTIAATAMLIAREFGVEVPFSQADKTMKELLENYEYDTDI